MISVASNVAPKAVADMVHAALRGDWATARALHRQYYRLFTDLFLDTNPIPVKAAMAMMGQMRGDLPPAAVRDERETVKDYAEALCNGIRTDLDFRFAICDWMVEHE